MLDFADSLTFESGMAFQSTSLAGISIERLQTLCAVVETGSIAAAAGPDPNRQSQFSRQLKELEKALGTNLFDRVGKTLKPNEQGRRVALASQTFFASLDEVMNAALAKPGLWFRRGQRFKDHRTAQRQTGRRCRQEHQGFFRSRLDLDTGIGTDADPACRRDLRPCAAGLLHLAMGLWKQGPHQCRLEV